MKISRVCGITMLALFATIGVQALSFDPWYVEAVRREPELANIERQYRAGMPPLNEYVGRTGHEHERAIRNYTEQYRRSLGPETAKLIEQKLAEALQADPPDTQVVMLALLTARLAPNARLFEMAEWVLDNISVFPRGDKLPGHGDLFTAALRLLAMSPDPDHAVKFQSYTELETVVQLAREHKIAASGLVIMIIEQTRTPAEALAEYERILQKMDEDLQELPVDETTQFYANHMKRMIESSRERIRGLDGVFQISTPPNEERGK